MTQQIMTIVSIVQDLVLGGGPEQNILMSDKLLLAVKEHAGKLKSHEAGLAVNTAGDLGTLTAAAGKDLYLLKAHANVALATIGNNSGLGQIVLKVNGVIKDTWNFALTNTSGEGSTTMDDHDFLTGFKVGPTEIIKLEVISAGVSALTEGSIECSEEPTGVSPYVASEFE